MGFIPGQPGSGRLRHSEPLGTDCLKIGSTKASPPSPQPTAWPRRCDLQSLNFDLLPSAPHSTKTFLDTKPIT